MFVTRALQPSVSGRRIIEDDLGRAANALRFHNPDQQDSDGDLVGDVCDVCPTSIDNRSCDPAGAEAGSIDYWGGTMKLVSADRASPLCSVRLGVGVGALYDAQSLFMQLSADPSGDSPSGRILEPACEFGPEGITFDQPVLIEFTYEPSLVSDPRDLDVFYNDEGTWIPQNALLDAEASTLSIETTHFSLYALGIKDDQPPQIQAAFLPLSVGEDLGEFEVDVQVTDDLDTDPQYTAALQVPVMPDAAVELTTAEVVWLEFDLELNKIEIRGPDPAALWASVQALGGLPVADGQTVSIRPDPTMRIEFIMIDGVLSIEGMSPDLLVTATDGSGHTTTAVATPSF